MEVGDVSCCDGCDRAIAERGHEQPRRVAVGRAGAAGRARRPSSRNRSVLTPWPPSPVRGTPTTRRQARGTSRRGAGVPRCPAQARRAPHDESERARASGSLPALLSARRWSVGRAGAVSPRRHQVRPTRAPQRGSLACPHATTLRTRRPPRVRFRVGVLYLLPRREPLELRAERRAHRRAQHRPQPANLRVRAAGSSSRNRCSCDRALLSTHRL